MSMTMSSLRIPDELASFYERLAAAYPEKFETKADAMRAALEFYRDFHMLDPMVERHIVAGFEPPDPAIKRMILDVPKDDYNMLRSIQNMGRGASVPEIIRSFLRRFIRSEVKAVQRDKEELRRALEAVRAHDNELRMRDSHLTR
ncbi:MAG: hypothetical protein QW379_08845 [Thermoplasmata archaeon]